MEHNWEWKMTTGEPVCSNCFIQQTNENINQQCDGTDIYDEDLSET